MASNTDKQGTEEGKWWKRAPKAIWKYLFARRKPEKERTEDSRFVVFIKWLVWTIIKVLVLVAIAMGIAVVTLFGVQIVSPTFFGLVEDTQFGVQIGCLSLFWLEDATQCTGSKVEGLLTVLVAYLTLLIAAGSIFGYIFIKKSSIAEAKEIATTEVDRAKEAVDQVVEEAVNKTEQAVEQVKKAVEQAVQQTEQAVDEAVEQAKEAFEEYTRDLAEEVDTFEQTQEKYNAMNSLLNYMDAEEGSADVLDPIAEASTYHIVNTNSRYDADAYEYMLSKERASAFGVRKQLIYSIKKGDRIFLYHSGKGIVAGGIAGSPMRGEESDIPYGTEEVYVELSDFVDISDNSLTYDKICKIADGYKPLVASTRARVRRSAGDKIWKALQKRWDELQKSPKAE